MQHDPSNICFAHSELTASFFEETEERQTLTSLTGTHLPLSSMARVSSSRVCIAESPSSVPTSPLRSQSPPCTCRSRPDTARSASSSASIVLPPITLPPISSHPRTLPSPSTHLHPPPAPALHLFPPAAYPRDPHTYYLPTLFAAGNHAAQPYTGLVETPLDALRLVNAARHSVIPLTTRRLKQDERRALIRSGAVFVFNVRASRMKRWTDGLAWTVSHDTGSFMMYYERPANMPRREANRHDLTDQGGQVIGPENLIKKAVTIIVRDEEFHLVAYFTSADRDSGRLRTLASRPDILGLRVDSGTMRIEGRMVDVCVGDNNNMTVRKLAADANSADGRVNIRTSPPQQFQQQPECKQEHSSPVMPARHFDVAGTSSSTPPFGTKVKVEISAFASAIAATSPSVKYPPPTSDPPALPLPRHEGLSPCPHPHESHPGPMCTSKPTPPSSSRLGSPPPPHPCLPSLRAVHMWPDPPR
ncbi:hypothetical protein MKEN_01416900 [Mycena kentingensis (nom. inval.)]|nr:hypothetical protein MKEN_01416900 [Mycena kentingensis (nom. inval.)]